MILSWVMNNAVVNYTLIEGLPAKVVMADAAYDADPLRREIADKGAIAVIPQPVTGAQIPNRQTPLCLVGEHAFAVAKPPQANSEMIFLLPGYSTILRHLPSP